MARTYCGVNCALLADTILKICVLYYFVENIVLLSLLLSFFVEYFLLSVGDALILISNRLLISTLNYWIK
jgi:hypothetical protein